MHTDCAICQILADKPGNALMTEYWSVSLAQDQGYVGRCYVTLRTHKESLSDLSEAEWLDFAALGKRLEGAAATAFNAAPFNWDCMMNNDTAGFLVRFSQNA